jgi:hypothetical protein
MAVLTQKIHSLMSSRKTPKISVFPKFTKLTLADTVKIGVETRSSEPRMDLSPASIQSFYNFDGSLAFSRLNSNLLAKYYDPEIKETVYVIYGTNKFIESVNKLFHYQKSIGQEQKITNIDTAQAEILRLSGDFIVEPMEDAFEYIIKTIDHSHITDPRLKDEAMHIRSFVRRYGDDICINELNMAEPSAITKIINSWHVWDHHYKNNNNDVDASERGHVSAYLEGASELNTRCIVITYLGQIVGFTFFDIYKEYSCAVGQFMKVDYAYSHAFDFLVHALCSKLYTEGIQYINIENDLGISGIRYKKQSLLPVKMLKFYTAIPKT